MEKLHKFREIIDRQLQLCLQQKATLEAVKDVLKQVVRSGNIIHMFGTGHSHAATEEFFYRAGGLVCVNAILEEPLMLHIGGQVSSVLERIENYAELILQKHNTSPQDAMIIFSNSGINAVPVEMAIRAKKRKIPVIAFTSVKSYSTMPPRSSTGKHLYEVSDYVIDTGIPYGDASIELSDGTKVAPTSSIVNCTLMHGILAQLAYELVEEGEKIPVFTSANTHGGKERNEAYISQYRSRVRSL